MLTLEQVIKTHGVQVDEHLDREATIPVSAGLQRQGDIIVVPDQLVKAHRTAATSVPREGVAVVRGENGGNTHLLLAAGAVRYDTSTGGSSGLDLGVLDVADGATAYLAHPEHGYAGIAPGLYVIRRQREQADVIRLVAD